MSLIVGLRALKQKRYQDAVDLLSRVGVDGNGDSVAEEDFIGARVGLIAAYEGVGDRKRADALRQELEAQENVDLNFWSLEMVFSLLEEAEQEEEKIVLPPLPKGPAEIAQAADDDDETRPLTDLADLPLPRLDGPTELLRPASPPRQSNPAAKTPARDKQAQPQRSSRAGAAPAPKSASTPPQISKNSKNDQLLQRGHQAVLQKRYAEAIRDLKAYGKAGFDINSSRDQYALMALVKAYRGSRQIDDAIAACKQLTACQDPTVQSWVDETLSSLYEAQSKQARFFQGQQRVAPSRQQVYPFPKAGRAPGQTELTAPAGFPQLLPVVLATLAVFWAIPGVVVGAASWFLGMPLLQAVGLGASGAFVLLVSLFFLSPWIGDNLLASRARLRWSNWPGLETYSREAASMLRRLGREHNTPQPRLGVIDSPFPFIATYGFLPSTARIVASKGLLSILDEAELATIYIREFGHIVRWDFALATLAAIVSQCCYLFYCWCRDFGVPRPSEDDEAERPIAAAGKFDPRQVFLALVRALGYKFFLLHAVASGIAAPFSRIRTYHADLSAARATGNPNDLARSLFKMAYGSLDAEEKAGYASPLGGGLAIFSPLSPQSVAMAGGAYRSASEPQQVGRLLLWDMFNPWATWFEFFSFHPLLGKRLQVLGGYAEQLSLSQEFDLTTVLRQERELLDRRKLEQPFYSHWLLYHASPLLAVAAAVGGAIAARVLALQQVWLLCPAVALLGFAFGTFLRVAIMFPGAKRMPLIQANSLVADPYLSPLRGRLSRLQGKLFGHANAPCRPDALLHLQDTTGGLELRYTSRLGGLGNLASRHEGLQELIGQEVTVSGWYRRSDRPWLEIDRIELRRGAKQTVKGHPRYWTWVQLTIAALLGLGLIQLRLWLLANPV